MLKRKEILTALRRCGVYKFSELKSGCREYENYFRKYLTKLVAVKEKTSDGS
ncbi:MAG: hypothetical protein HY579_08985 [Nitrospinae bacterium]|nr:hypothetical protein [Nitrospinota bacterium]MBI5426727.1 hypothetical protein [Nitrospinota bacterium]